MPSNDFLQHEALSYGLTIQDIQMAIRSLNGLQYFISKTNEEQQFTIRRGKEGTPMVFPGLGVRLLLAVLANLAQGEVPALVSRYLAFSLEDAAMLLKVSEKQLIKLLEQGLIPLHENQEAKQIILSDAINYIKKEKMTILKQEELPFIFSPQEIIATFNAHPELQTLIEAGDDMLPDQFYLIRKGLELVPFQISLPILKIVIKILSKMTIADAIVTIPLPYALTIDEAAHLLNVSDKHVTELLHKKAIPYHQIDSLNRIHLSDLLAYKKIQDQKSQAALNELTKLNTEIIEIEDESELK